LDDVAASRRRVWFALLLAATFLVALSVGLTTTPSTHPLHVQTAAAATVNSHHATHRAGAPVSSTSTTAVPTTAAPVRHHAATPSSEVRAALTRSTERATVARVAAVAPTTTRVPVTAPPTTAAPTTTIAASAAAFLACIRARESHGNYGAVSAGGTYRGAYQFSQSSWNLAASHAGRKDLVGELPNLASPADQDAMALELYEMMGSAPWGGACA